MIKPTELERDSILKTVHSYAGTHRPIEDSKGLLHDLSINGDDALELLEDIHKRYGTIFTDFDFDSYFYAEGEDIGGHLFRRLGFKEKKKKFTVGHLINVVRTGYWFEEPFSS